MHVYIELDLVLQVRCMNKDLRIVLLGMLIMSCLLPTAYAAEAETNATVSKVFGATVAFCVAVAAAGFSISKAGSAGLAASAERPEVRTVAIIIAAFGEALAIYGIAIAFFILSA